MTAALKEMLERALSAVLEGEEVLRAALDGLPAAMYVTDASGVVSYFNPACIDFTGRRPETGADRWFVTWRLYTSAVEFLPHDQCPMAVAINNQRSVRGVTAIAERPDGTRVRFRPYPTPFFDKEGKFAGAVNLLEDTTDEFRAHDLLAQAQRCRRLAKGISDDMAMTTLNRMADEYEAQAEELRVQLAEKLQ